MQTIFYMAKQRGRRSGTIARSVWLALLAFTLACMRFLEANKYQHIIIKILSTFHHRKQTRHSMKII